jgi:hypothetical protein
MPIARPRSSMSNRQPVVGSGIKGVGVIFLCARKRTEGLKCNPSLPFNCYKNVFAAVLTSIALMVFTGQVSAQVNKGGANTAEDKGFMKVRVTANRKTTVFELNNSQAARDLYAQLPLSLKVENYSDNEKIFYPPKKLNTTNTPQADAKAGTLAYYAPWGDVVMFYGDFGRAAGLYELGHAVSGDEHINEMAGTIRIEVVP